MPDQLPAQRIQVTPEDMFVALGTAWQHYFNSDANASQLCLLLAQWALETGSGAAMWNYNIGNVKSREGDGRDYTYFSCFEIEKGQKVWYHPDDPTCRFRAFKTLALGAADYLDLLVNRFGDNDPEKDAWGAVGKADPVAFCHALKLKGYYTADEGQYTAGVMARFRHFLQSGFDITKIPPLSTEEKDQLQAWTAGTAAQGLAESIEGATNDEPPA